MRATENTKQTYTLEASSLLDLNVTDKLRSGRGEVCFSARR
jgi:hypothetical protein